MVRRLKEDLRRFGEPFPERNVSPIVLDKVPADAPELVLAARLAAYNELREERISTLTRAKAAEARLVFAGLQTRLLSSIPAFASTLKMHRAALQRALNGAMPAGGALNTELLVAGQSADDAEPALDEAAALSDLDQREASAIDSATLRASAGAQVEALRRELAAVDDMLVLGLEQFRREVG